MQQNSWIENTGVQPVGNNVMVEVVLRNGSKSKDRAWAWSWDLRDSDEDILHYRDTAKLTLDDAYDVPPKPSLHHVKYPSGANVEDYFVVTETGTLKGSFFNSEELYQDLKRPESKYDIPVVAPLTPEQQIVEIYKIAFGEHIDEKVVSRVLQIFHDKQRWEE